jgi:glucose-1-phosphate thymidylyltransferase
MVVEDAEASRGIGSTRPVPATEHVANRPIAHHVVDALEAVGVEHIVVAASTRTAAAMRECLSALDRSSRASLEFVEQPAPVELGSALRLVAPIIHDWPCIVHAAGGLLAEPLTSVAECLSEGPDAVLMVHQTQAPERRLSAEVQSVLHLAELDPSRYTLGLAGVWAFGPGAVREVAARPATAEVGLVDVAQRITAGGGTVQVRLADFWGAYEGEAVDLLDLNRIALDRIPGEPHRPMTTANDNRIEGRVWIHPEATVRSSVIVGPTVIGAGADIADAYIGPYTSIGAGARVVGAEVERSIIAVGASVMHLGGRMVSSVVGRDARVFRDFSLPRALRLRVGEGTEVALC